MVADSCPPCDCPARAAKPEGCSSMGARFPSGTASRPAALLRGRQHEGADITVVKPGPDDLAVLIDADMFHATRWPGKAGHLALLVDAQAFVEQASSGQRG